MNPLPLSYYQHPDVVHLAKDLLGKKLCTYIGDELTSGIITETEAYCGRNDKACHANNNKRTTRTEIMFQQGGHAYVYLCYGIHNLFNITTNVDGLADAILIRAMEPVDGLKTMMVRRGKNQVDKTLTSGPGSLSKALGIERSHYGLPLNSSQLWIEESSKTIRPSEIITATRIGVDYAEEDALLPWRFYLNDSKYVSKR